MIVNSKLKIDHQTSQQQKSPERVGEKEEQKPILGHCSNLLQIEVDAKFIYTAEQGMFQILFSRLYFLVIRFCRIGITSNFNIFPIKVIFRKGHKI